MLRSKKAFAVKMDVHDLLCAISTTIRPKNLAKCTHLSAGDVFCLSLSGFHQQYHSVSQVLKPNRGPCNAFIQLCGETVCISILVL